MAAPTDDEVLAALDQVTVALSKIATQSEGIASRADDIRTDRRAGRSYTEIANSESQPLIVETMRDLTAMLTEAGGALRRAEAAALHREGLTMDRIAELFGVTRQRVSALLKSTQPAVASSKRRAG